MKMLRYLTHRRYQPARRVATIFLLSFSVAFVFLHKLFSSHMSTTAARPSKKVVNDKEREAKKLMHLTDRRRFNDKYVYDIVRFSELQPEHESRKENFLKGRRYRYFLPEYRISARHVPPWFPKKQTFCSGCFVSYGKTVAILKDVIIDPSFANNVRGGEELDAIFNQTEESEYLDLHKGYFFLTTNNEIPHLNDKDLSHEFKVYLDALVVENIKLTADRMYQKTTIVTVRHEYANFYHTMMDWYNIFLIMVLFRAEPKSVKILLLDGHPMSALDSAWKTLFNDVEQARQIKEPTLVRDMIWNAVGANCPLNQHKAGVLPFSSEFRHFLLSQHAIADNHRINCHKMKINIIFRHKYVAHPRNPSGFISRKIRNEIQLVQSLKQALNRDDINGRVLDSLSMKEQLSIISETDILIGMHGAGLSHILFLPNTSGLIELMPRYFSPTNKHFYAMAKWRQLDYMMWRNEDPELEKENHFTVVPPDLLIEMVQEMKNLLCSQFADENEKPDSLESENNFFYDIV